MVKCKEKRNSEAHWEEIRVRIWWFLEFNFKFLIFISVFHDTDFKPNTKLWIKNIYTSIYFSVEYWKTWDETKYEIFFVILVYLYSSPRIKSKVEALETRPNEPAYCSCGTKELRLSLLACFQFILSRNLTLKVAVQATKYLLSNLQGPGSSLDWNPDYIEGFFFFCNFLSCS
jgi:hypothetical protein